MDLFIRIKDGQPFEHPIFGDNFRQAFPEVDTNNLPPEFARFERVVAPALGVYEKGQRCVYERGEDGVYRDVWYPEPMTEQEKKERQDAVKEHWATNPLTPKSWSFDEATCSFVPPTPRPTDDKMYDWRESDKTWVEIPLPPEDGQNYRFNIESESWELE